MTCPKCRHENPDETQYCSRCHAPLRFTCPACKHVQQTGGKCEQCGVDFAKYAAMLVFKAQQDSEQARQVSRARTGIVKQILLLPITGGLSLAKYLLGRIRGD